MVGAGVSGLTSALLLAEAGFRVRILTRDPSLQTTSAVAAATWYPLRGERDARVEGWLPVSFERFVALAADSSSGVRLRTGIELFRAPVDDTWWRDVLPGFRHARPEELPPGFVDAFIAEGVPVIEMPVYLEWLGARVREAGVTIELRAISSFEEIEADVVVNCAGLGARWLAGDDSVRPVRGQVVRVRQFGLERYILDENNPDGITYIYPRGADVVCGGTREHDDWEIKPREDTARDILRRCALLEPRVAGAEIISHGVGLRPSRPSVRLEAEGRVVHNYGHGGSGVTLSWGCADEVVGLVRRLTA